MRDFEQMKTGVELLTNYKNTVIFDDTGIPSVIVKINKITSVDIFNTTASYTSPAFRDSDYYGTYDTVGFSKFLNTVINERAYSLPLKQPSIVTKTNAIKYCRNKGNGWALMPLSLFAAIALYTRKNNIIAHGNTYNGKDFIYTNETSKVLNGSNYTGSGPITWTHDHTAAGICDFTGNVYKHVADVRYSYSGELQFIKNADSIECDLSDSSSSWKSIMYNNNPNFYNTSFVNEGESYSIKYFNYNNIPYFCTSVPENTTFTSAILTYKNITIESGTNLPEYLKYLGFYIDNVNGIENSRITFPAISTLGTGYYSVTVGADSRTGISSPFCINLSNSDSSGAGFFSVYYDSYFS